jgi:hypothetical protein
MTYERKHQGSTTLYNRKQYGHLNVGLSPASEIPVPTSASWEVLACLVSSQRAKCTNGIRVQVGRQMRILAPSVCFLYTQWRCLVSKLYSHIFFYIQKWSSLKNNLLSAVYFPTVSASKSLDYATQNVTMTDESWLERIWKEIVV